MPLWDADDELVAYTLVDADQARRFEGEHLRYNPAGYAVCRGKLVHRLVLGLTPGDGVVGHHVNGERLDNRRGNLRALNPDEHAVEHGKRSRRRSPLQLDPALMAHPAIGRGLDAWLLDDQSTADDPASDPIVHAMAGKTLPKTLTREQVDALMSMPNLDCPTGLRDRALMELMYRAGLRVSEACGLHLRDWRRREAQLHLRPEIAKGGKEGYAYLDPVAEDFLTRWVAVRRRHAAKRPHLFTTLGGNALDRRDVWAMVARRARKAGIGHAHPHMLRHSFATSLLADGFNVREVQRLLRHADLRTTAIYLEVRDEELAAKIRGRAGHRVGVS